MDQRLLNVAKSTEESQGLLLNKSRLFRYAKDAVERAGKYAYRDRRKRNLNSASCGLSV